MALNLYHERGFGWMKGCPCYRLFFDQVEDTVKFLRGADNIAGGGRREAHLAGGVEGLGAFNEAGAVVREQHAVTLIPEMRRELRFDVRNHIAAKQFVPFQLAGFL